MTPLLLVALLLGPAAKEEEQPKLPVVDVTEKDLKQPPPPTFVPAVPKDEEVKEPQVSVMGGGTVVLGTAAPSSMEPLARVAVDWNLAGVERALEAHVEADFTGLPDAQIALSSARDFRALEMSMGLSYHASEKLSASGYCETGFASRLSDGTPEPKTSAPLWSSCGIWFADKGEHRARLRIGVGPDERLGWGWTLAAHIKGSIRLVERSSVGVTVLVRAILGLETPVGQKQRVNVVKIGRAHV